MLRRVPCGSENGRPGSVLRSRLEICVLQANRVKDEVLSRLKATLASPDDLAKIPAMLEDAEKRHAASGAALSEHIGLHCAQLRTGLNDMAAALNETDAIKSRLKLILKLCRDSEVLSPGEGKHASGIATVQVLTMATSDTRSLCRLGPDRVQLLCRVPSHQIPCHCPDCLASVHQLRGCYDAMPQCQ